MRFGEGHQREHEAPMDVKSEVAVGRSLVVAPNCQKSPVTASSAALARINAVFSFALATNVARSFAVTFPIHAIGSLIKNFLFRSIYRRRASDKVAITWCYRPMRPRNATASTWGGCRKLLSGTPTGTLSSGRFGSTTGCQPKPWFNTELPIPRSFNVLIGSVCFPRTILDMSIEMIRPSIIRAVLKV